MAYSTSVSEILIFACIKGYHAYKIRPTVGDILDVRRNEKNQYDKNAIGIYDTRGHLVGHVPAKPVPLNMCIKEFLEKYSIKW